MPPSRWRSVSRLLCRRSHLLLPRQARPPLPRRPPIGCDQHFWPRLPSQNRLLLSSQWRPLPPLCGGIALRLLCSRSRLLLFCQTRPPLPRLCGTSSRCDGCLRPKQDLFCSAQLVLKQLLLRKEQLLDCCRIDLSLRQRGGGSLLHSNGGSCRHVVAVVTASLPPSSSRAMPECASRLTLRRHKRAGPCGRVWCRRFR